MQPLGFFEEIEDGEFFIFNLESGDFIRLGEHLGALMEEPPVPPEIEDSERAKLALGQIEYAEMFRPLFKFMTDQAAFCAAHPNRFNSPFAFPFDAWQVAGYYRELDGQDAYDDDMLPGEYFEIVNSLFSITVLFRGNLNFYLSFEGPVDSDGVLLENLLAWIMQNGQGEEPEITPTVVEEAKRAAILVFFTVLEDGAMDTMEVQRTIEA